jgi:CBS-domain-containing membrane protein
MDSVTARDIMSPDIISARTDTPVSELARLMADNRLRAVPIFDQQDQLVGVVSEEDLVHQDARVHYPTFFHFLEGYIMLPGSMKKFESDLQKAVGATAEEVMDTKYPTARPSSDITEIATILVDKDYEYILVVDGGTLAGLITRADIVRALAREGASG